MRPFGTHTIVKDIKLKEDINEKGKCTFLKLVSGKLKLNCLNVGSADFKPRRTKRVECLRNCLRARISVIIQPNQTL